MSDLVQKHCEACEGIANALTAEQVKNLMSQVPLWKSDDAATEIVREFNFDDFHQTMAFVNAIAWMAHQENHHPDLKVGYNYCHVRYSTHALDGLSHNDFICAAKVDHLLLG